VPKIREELAGNEKHPQADAGVMVFGYGVSRFDASAKFRSLLLFLLRRWRHKRYCDA
jgi:hypothetical protein